MSINDNGKSRGPDTYGVLATPQTGLNLRETGKRLVKTALMNSGVLAVAFRLAPNGIVVLHYHSVQDNTKRFANAFVPGTIHALSLFEEQMELVAHRYCPVGMDDVLRSLNGEVNLPPRAVAVTFDDGFADNFELAAPVLNRLGIRALFNLVVGSIEAPNPPWFCRLHHAFSTTTRETWPDSSDGCIRPIANPEDRRAAFLTASRRCAMSIGRSQEGMISKIEEELDAEPLERKNCPMMTWDQARELRRMGHLIGSHSLSHPNLAYLDDLSVWTEVVESKARLEAELRGPVDYFSYPNPIMTPNFDERTIRITEQAGYKLAAHGDTGPVRAGQNPLSVHRVPAPWSLGEFIWYIENTMIGRRL